MAEIHSSKSAEMLKVLFDEVLGSALTCSYSLEQQVKKALTQIRSAA